MSIVEPSPLSYVLEGKVTPRKKVSAPKTPATPKKSKPTKTARNLFGSVPAKPKKKKASKLPKLMYIVCDELTGQPISVHRTKHGADTGYWKLISESDKRFIIVECKSGKD